ncbi:uncharacterized protein [Panulirus ornatus]|uniref:uncharacterized protein n=1 Tax=Panulirus ornatus TaxID=150431 RepID=UPI003A88E737
MMAEEKEIDIYRDTPLRLLGYANEVGEAFRALTPLWFVRSTYGVASAYVVADTYDKTKRMSKQPGATQKAIVHAAVDTLIWQALASVIVPGFTINRVCATSLYAMARVIPKVPLTTRGAKKLKMVSITRPKGEENAKKIGQKAGKGSELIKERKRKQKDKRALRMKLTEKQKDIEATAKPSQEKQGEKVQEVEGEDLEVEDQKVTRKEEDQKVAHKQEDEEVSKRKKRKKKKKKKKKKEAPAKEEENHGGLTQKDAVGTSGKTMEMSKTKKKRKVTATVKKDGSGPAYPKAHVAIKFEENNLMTLYDGVWVMKSRVSVIDKIKEKKKAAIIAARKGDENVYGDALTALELQILNEKKMKRELRNAHRFLIRKLINLERLKMKK